MGRKSRATEDLQGPVPGEQLCPSTVFSTFYETTCYQHADDFGSIWFLARSFSDILWRFYGCLDTNKTELKHGMFYTTLREQHLRNRTVLFVRMLHLDSTRYFLWSM